MHASLDHVKAASLSLTHLVLEAVSRVSVADGGLLHGRRERGLRRPPVEAGAAVGRLIKT